jgi:putative transposase
MASQGGKQHKPEQIVRKLQEAESMLKTGKTIAEACQAIGVSEQTFYRWRNLYGSMQPQDARRLHELERDNARLRKLVVELRLDVQMLKELSRGNF